MYRFCENSAYMLGDYITSSRESVTESESSDRHASIVDVIIVTEQNDASELSKTIDEMSCEDCDSD